MSLRRWVWLTAVVAGQYLLLGVVVSLMLPQPTLENINRRPYSAGDDVFDRHVFDFPVIATENVSARGLNSATPPGIVLPSGRTVLNPAVIAATWWMLVGVPLCTADLLARRSVRRAVRPPPTRPVRWIRVLTVTAGFAVTVALVEQETRVTFGYLPSPGNTAITRLWPFYGLRHQESWLHDAWVRVGRRRYEWEKQLPAEAQNHIWTCRTGLTLAAAAVGCLAGIRLFRPWRRSRVTTDTPSPRSPGDFPREFIGAPPPAGVECR